MGETINIKYQYKDDSAEPIEDNKYENTLNKNFRTQREGDVVHIEFFTTDDKGVEKITDTLTVPVLTDFLEPFRKLGLDKLAEDPISFSPGSLDREWFDGNIEKAVGVRLDINEGFRDVLKPQHRRG